MSGLLSTNYFASAEIASNTTIRLSTTIANRMIRRDIGGQFWTVRLNTSSLTQAEMSELYAFIVSQNGQYESFTVVPPIHGNSRGTASGTVTITQTYAAGLKTVRANGATGTLLKGDFIKFSNHDKVYMLTSDVNMDASSEDTINIFPGLFTAVTSATTVTYDNVPFKVMLNESNTNFQTQIDGTYKIDFTLREDI